MSKSARKAAVEASLAHGGCPIAPAVAREVKGPTRTYWTLRLLACPYCGDQHQHSPDDVEPEVTCGWRVAHCPSKAGASVGYVVLPALVDRSKVYPQGTF